MRRDFTQKNDPKIIHQLNVWLIDQISTGISLPYNEYEVSCTFYFLPTTNYKAYFGLTIEIYSVLMFMLIESALWLVKMNYIIFNENVKLNLEQHAIHLVYL